jgi:hypothetical protein
MPHTSRYGAPQLAKILAAGVATLGLVLWAHQFRTIGGRVPMVFVALWFGSTAMVALVFSMAPVANDPLPVTREHLWRDKIRLALVCLLPLTLVPLLERAGVANDPAVWLLDGALVISLCTVPYFTLVAHTAFGGAVLSLGAFQALWIAGASMQFVIMEHLAQAKGAGLPDGGTFEDLFRPEYRFLFYILCVVMGLGYCPAILWLGHRRFVRPTASPPAALGPVPPVG